MFVDRLKLTQDRKKQKCILRVAHSRWSSKTNVGEKSEKWNNKHEGD